MTATKRWIPQLQTDSQEMIDKISWNSSESSDEYEEIRKPKKIKAYFPYAEQNLNSVEVNRKCFKTMVKQKDSKPLVHFEICEQTSSAVPSISSSSPIIDCYKFDRNSPVLTTINLNSEFESPVLTETCIAREKSPVLTNIERLRELQLKRKSIVNFSKLKQSSPDLFLSQATQIIEENDSPDCITKKNTQQLNQIETIPSPDYSAQKIIESTEVYNQIEIISSQDSSSIAIINSSSENSLRTSDLSSQCYHQPVPRRRFCKKGGLLHQLQKTMNLQQSRVSLWHHDIFCKNIVPSQIEHISCMVMKKLNEFGCVLLECYVKKSEEMSTEDSILVCLGHNINSKVLCEIGETIRIFHPFKEKLVQCQNKKMKFYYNISKILTENECSTVRNNESNRHS